LLKKVLQPLSGELHPPKIKNAPPLNRSCTPLTGFYQNYGSLPEITPVVGFSGCWLFFQFCAKPKPLSIASAEVSFEL
jgi:hypothetical protein